MWLACVPKVWGIDCSTIGGGASAVPRCVLLGSEKLPEEGSVGNHATLPRPADQTNNVTAALVAHAMEAGADHFSEVSRLGSSILTSRKGGSATE